MRVTVLLCVICALLGGFSGCNKRDATADSHDTTAPDNTAVNKRDADGDTLTPIDQGNSQADVERTAKIRQDILNAEGMSVDARNAKIITNNGKVTLRGPVASAEEKAAIERIAVAAAGEGNVTNQLEIAASK